MIIDYIVSKKVMLYVYRVINMYILVRKKKYTRQSLGKDRKEKTDSFLCYIYKRIFILRKH